MRRVQAPLPSTHFMIDDLTYHWHVGMLTKKIWDQMPGPHRTELAKMVNHALITMARKYSSDPD